MVKYNKLDDLWVRNSEKYLSLLLSKHVK